MTPQEEAELFKKYGEDLVLQHYEKFDMLMLDRSRAIEKLNQENIKQRINFAEFRRIGGGNKEWDFEGHLKEMNKRFDADELAIAKDAGLKEKELTREQKIALMREITGKEPVKEKVTVKEKKTLFDLDSKQDDFMTKLKEAKERSIQKENNKILDKDPEPPTPAVKVKEQKGELTDEMTKQEQERKAKFIEELRKAQQQDLEKEERNRSR